MVYSENNTNKEYSFQFDKEQVDKSVDKNQVLQMADLFKNFKKNENDFTFDFKTSEGLIKKLKIELK